MACDITFSPLLMRRDKTRMDRKTVQYLCLCRFLMLSRATSVDALLSPPIPVNQEGQFSEGIGYDVSCRMSSPYMNEPGCLELSVRVYVLPQPVIRNCEMLGILDAMLDTQHSDCPEKAACVCTSKVAVRSTPSDKT